MQNSISFVKVCNNLGQCQKSGYKGKANTTQNSKSLDPGVKLLFWQMSQFLKLIAFTTVSLSNVI